MSNDINEVAPVVQQYAARSQYEEILKELEMPYSLQSGFLRVDGPKGRRLYVASTKTVRRVDVSGFEFGLGKFTQVPHCGPFGSVAQQIIMTGTPDEQLSRFREVASHMRTLAPVEKEVPKPKAPKQARTPFGKQAAPQVVPEIVLTEEQKEQQAKERRARIEAYAAKIGAPVHPDAGKPLPPSPKKWVPYQDRLY